MKLRGKDPVPHTSVYRLHSLTGSWACLFNLSALWMSRSFQPRCNCMSAWHVTECCRRGADTKCCQPAVRGKAV